MKEVVKAAQSGDTSAWHLLYNQHYPWLYAGALRMIGNSPDAKDIIQETFVQAYLKLDQLKDPAAFPAWLKTILTRCCYHSIRQRSRFICPDVVKERKEVQWQDEINRQLDKYELNTRLYNTLACLSGISQTILLLRHFSSCQSYEEIAEVLSIPVGTVRSRLNQAREKMSQQWAKSSDDNDNAVKQSDEWNSLYGACFTYAHSSLSYREKLITTFDKGLEIIFSSGKKAFGRLLIQGLIEEDMTYGNTFSNVHVVSSGPVSIIETHNRNSVEYPDRCPENSIFVLFRENSNVRRIHIHNSR